MQGSLAGVQGSLARGFGPECKVHLHEWLILRESTQNPYFRTSLIVKYQLNLLKKRAKPSRNELLIFIEFEGAFP